MVHSPLYWSLKVLMVLTILDAWIVNYCMYCILRNISRSCKKLLLIVLIRFSFKQSSDLLLISIIFSISLSFLFMAVCCVYLTQEENNHSKRWTLYVSTFHSRINSQNKLSDCYWDWANSISVTAPINAPFKFLNITNIYNIFPNITVNVRSLEQGTVFLCSVSKRTNH